MSNETTPEQDTQFYQMINQANARFDAQMQERAQMFNQQMVALINQTTGSLQLQTTYNMTQAGNIVIEQPVNLP
jgi:hypothetical protein